jgi:CheY-like chemotaxis protein
MQIAAQKHFLVIEDNPDDAFLIARVFRKLPFCTAYICRNASEARAYIQGAGIYGERSKFPTPSAVLSDSGLSGELGAEFLGWLRKNPHFKEFPVYILTGSASVEDMDASRSLGASKVLKKPVQLEALEELLASVALEICNTPS